MRTMDVLSSEWSRLRMGEHLNRDVFSAVMELVDEEEADMAPNAELLRRARDIVKGKNLLSLLRQTHRY
jgi:hypothetical protein